MECCVRAYKHKIWHQSSKHLLLHTGDAIGNHSKSYTTATTFRPRGILFRNRFVNAARTDRLSSTFSYVLLTAGLLTMQLLHATPTKKNIADHNKFWQNAYSSDGNRATFNLKTAVGIIVKNICNPILACVCDK